MVAWWKSWQCSFKIFIRSSPSLPSPRPGPTRQYPRFRWALHQCLAALAGWRSETGSIWVLQLLKWGRHYSPKQSRETGTCVICVDSQLSFHLLIMQNKVYLENIRTKYIFLFANSFLTLSLDPSGCSLVLFNGAVFGTVCFVPTSL